MLQPQYVFNLSNPWQHKDNTKNTTVTREDELIQRSELSTASFTVAMSEPTDPHHMSTF